MWEQVMVIYLLFNDGSSVLPMTTAGNSLTERG